MVFVKCFQCKPKLYLLDELKDCSAHISYCDQDFLVPRYGWSDFSETFYFFTEPAGLYFVTFLCSMFIKWYIYYSNGGA